MSEVLTVTCAMVEHPSTHLYDEGRCARWNALVEEYDGAKSDLLREIIDEAAARRLDGVEPEDVLADGEDEEPPITETYDPDEYDGELTPEELKELKGEVEEINPDHVPYGEVPNGYAVPLVAAMSRYEYDRVSRADVTDICVEVGLTSDYYLEDKDVPGRVVQVVGGDVDASGTVDDSSPTDDVGARDVIARSAGMALLRVDASGGIALRDMAEAFYEDIKSLEDDDVREVTNTAFTVDVVRNALYELTGGPDGGGRLSNLAYDEEKLAEEKEDWPHDPEELVERYVAEREPEWKDNDGLKEGIAEDIGRFVEDDE